MTALAGDHIQVHMDDAAGTLQTFNDGDITMVDLGLTYTQHDVTGFGHDAQRFINGQMQAPVTIKGFLTTDATVGTHTVINSAFQNGAQVTLQVDIGQNAAPTTGDPQYSGEFIVESYKPAIENGSPVTFEATLKPADGSAPIWGTVS
jgi:hypothetical protein